MLMPVFNGISVRPASEDKRNSRLAGDYKRVCDCTLADMMSYSDLIFVVGRQRTGTTVFRELMAQHGAFDCDEIMHGDISRPNRFYAFVKKEHERNARAVHPETHRALFHRFINVLREKSNGQKLVLDVKYFGLNLIPSYEDVASASPFLVDYMRSSGAHVVHIVRQNKLRVLISELIAKQSGRWSAQTAEQLVSQKAKVMLRTDSLVSSIEAMQSVDETVKLLLDTVPNVHRLFYEDMFTNEGRFSRSSVDVAEKCLDRGDICSIPLTLKMNPEPIKTLVSNYDSIYDILSTTMHAWMLQE